MSKMYDNMPVRVCKDSNEHYHSQDQYISSSQLKTIAKKSVLHYLKEEPFNSPALTIGTAFHTMVLEPELFESEFLVVNETINKRTKVGKARFAELEKQAMDTDRLLLMGDDHKMLSKMSANVFKNKDYFRLLKACQKEISIYIDNFRVPQLDHDFFVRVRPDAYSTQPVKLGDKVLKNCVVDLKSCQDASPRAFKSSVYQYSWHVQAAYYLDLMTHTMRTLKKDEQICFEHFIFLAVEKKAPYAVQAYELNPALIVEGRRLYRKALKLWHEYWNSNEITGYHSGDDNPSSLIVL